MLLEKMTTREYKNATLLYLSALKEITTKIDILNEEFSIKMKYNPIEYVKSRLKTSVSMANKLVRRGYEPTFKNAVKYIDDIAGVRIICSFAPDIYKIASIIEMQSDINVLRIKDYIKNPKPNGYRSYHMLLEVPVYLSNELKNIRVELQIRTIAMDFWASLEHKIRYKFESSVPANINNDLLECANIVASLDTKMFELNRQIEKYK